MPKQINILKSLFVLSLIGLVYSTYDSINTITLGLAGAAPSMLSDASQILMISGILKAIIVLIPFISLLFLHKLKPFLRYFMVFICFTILLVFIYNAWFIFNLSFEGHFLPDDFSLFHKTLILVPLWSAITISYFMLVRSLKKK